MRWPWRRGPEREARRALPRVVVTALGPVSAIGSGRSDFYTALIVAPTIRDRLHQASNQGAEDRHPNRPHEPLSLPARSRARAADGCCPCALPAVREAELRRAMVSTLRLRLLKVGTTITESVRRVAISMPSSIPWKDSWRQAAAGVAALAEAPAPRHLRGA